MSARELVVLGTASQVPTRYRNHNGYLLRWDDEGILFDPGEGTQRQMMLAGVAVVGRSPASASPTSTATTASGCPGVLQRMSLDQVPHPSASTTRPRARSSSSGCARCALYDDTVDVRPPSRRRTRGRSTPGPEPFAPRGGPPRPPGRDLRLAARGAGRPPDAARAAGRRRHRRPRRRPAAARGVTASPGGRSVTLEEVSEPRPGQRLRLRHGHPPLRRRLRAGRRAPTCSSASRPS